MRRRRRWAHAPAIHAASHFDMKKELLGFLFSMHARDFPFCIGMGLRSAAHRARELRCNPARGPDPALLLFSCKRVKTFECKVVTCHGESTQGKKQPRVE